MMIAIALMGILVSFTLKVPSKRVKISEKEAPVIFMGCLNEELRDSLESMTFNRISVEEGRFEHKDDQRRIKKTVFYDEDVKINYGGDPTLSFFTNLDFTFRINSSGGTSGRVNFFRNGKVESYLMIHLGGSTMDLRD